MQKQIVLTESDVYDIRKTLFEARMLLENSEQENKKADVIRDLKRLQDLLKL